MRNYRIHILCFLSILPYLRANGFVEEVSCSSGSLTVVLNQSDPDLARWIMDKNSQPIVYVHNHREIRQCGSSIKSNGSLNLHLQIPYGPICNVNLADLEPNHSAAETTIVIEDNADNSRNGYVRINHVYCLYTKTVATIKFNDVSSSHKQIESTGGRPKPKVEMLFRGLGGDPLRAAKLGDTVEFYVALSPDGAYRGIVPKECRFADREDNESPDTKHFTFVHDGCPVEGTNELIDPLQNVNQEVYFSKFKTFRFGNQSTVFAHCTVQVCLHADQCYRHCFKRVQNSSLTAERLRFRHRRSTAEEMYQEWHLNSQIAILDGAQTKQVAERLPQLSAAAPNPDCALTPASTPTSALAVIAVLSVVSVASLSALIVFYVRNRRKESDSFDIYASMKNGGMQMSSAGYAASGYHPSYALRTHPYVHHLGHGEGTFR